LDEKINEFEVVSCEDVNLQITEKMLSAQSSTINSLIKGQLDLDANYINLN